MAAALTMAAIVSRHGARSPATEAEKHFTAAFVLVSSAPASVALLDPIVVWQEVFGGHASLAGAMSFEQQTGGRATMTARIGRRRTAADPAPLPPI